MPSKVFGRIGTRTSIMLASLSQALHTGHGARLQKHSALGTDVGGLRGKHVGMFQRKQRAFAFSTLML
jgi:hypothetical protein